MPIVKMISLPNLNNDVLRVISGYLGANDLLAMRSVNMSNMLISAYNESKVHQLCWNILGRPLAFSDIIVYDVDFSSAKDLLVKVRGSAANPNIGNIIVGCAGPIRDESEIVELCRTFTLPGTSGVGLSMIAAEVMAYGMYLNNARIIGAGHSIAGSSCFRKHHSLDAIDWKTVIKHCYNIDCDSCRGYVCSLICYYENSGFFVPYFGSVNRIIHWNGLANADWFFRALSRLDNKVRKKAIKKFNLDNWDELTEEYSTMCLRFSFVGSIQNFRLISKIKERFPWLVIMAIEIAVEDDSIEDVRYHLKAAWGSKKALVDKIYVDNFPYIEHIGLIGALFTCNS